MCQLPAMLQCWMDLVDYVIHATSLQSASRRVFSPQLACTTARWAGTHPKSGRKGASPNYKLSMPEKVLLTKRRKTDQSPHNLFLSFPPPLRPWLEGSIWPTLTRAEDWSRLLYLGGMLPAQRPQRAQRWECTPQPILVRKWNCGSHHTYEQG
jgi:hypothetical protein